MASISLLSLCSQHAGGVRLGLLISYIHSHSLATRRHSIEEYLFPLDLFELHFKCFIQQSPSQSHEAILLSQQSGYSRRLGNTAGQPQPTPSPSSRFRGIFLVTACISPGPPHLFYCKGFADGPALHEHLYRFAIPSR